MEKIIRIVNGIPTAVMISTAKPTLFDTTLLVTTDIGTAGVGYDTTHTVFTLPNGMTYDGTISELQVFLGDYRNGGVKLIEGVDFEYGPTAIETTITMLRPLPKNTRINFIKFA